MLNPPGSGGIFYSAGLKFLILDESAIKLFYGAIMTEDSAINASLRAIITLLRAIIVAE
jgi:hypothetical protein